MSHADTSEASTTSEFCAVQRTVAPSVCSSSIIISTSRMRGTLCSVTGRDVSSVAASSGNAAFLLPEAITSPERRSPP